MNRIQIKLSQSFRKILHCSDLRFKIKDNGNLRFLSAVNKNANGHAKTNNEIDFDYSSKVVCEFPNESPLEINKVWLRHHCRCKKCYNYSTNQRTMIPSELPKASIMTKMCLESDELHVMWEDAHISKFKKDFLIKNAPSSSNENQMTANIKETIPLESIFKAGNYDTINPLDSAISYDEFIKDGDDGVAHLLASILNHGFGIVDKCPADFETTKKVISKVSHPQNTIYGDFSEWTSNLAHADTAYTSDIVHLHTDTTYFTEPIGLQIFHCLKHDGTGGLNWLADGFNIARKIAKTRPELYNVLAQTIVPSQYIDSGKHHFRSNDVTIGHDLMSGHIQKIRYNPHDMEILSNIPQEQVEQFYESLVHFSNILEDKPIEIKLTPGLVIFLDNWRVLHGRTAFTGFRHLCGAYISRSDWLSRARTLKLIE